MKKLFKILGDIIGIIILLILCWSQMASIVWLTIGEGSRVDTPLLNTIIAILAGANILWMTWVIDRAFSDLITLLFGKRKGLE